MWLDNAELCDAHRRKCLLIHPLSGEPVVPIKKTRGPGKKK